jgi:hypothetical protein
MAQDVSNRARELITHERIKWRGSRGITRPGVVTFHELAPRLTRIEINLDVDTRSLIEQAARGMRHVKRAVRADLHRFKASIEMQELETGAWRGVIEDGELIEAHDYAYGEEREYSDLDDLRASDDARPRTDRKEVIGWRRLTEALPRFGEHDLGADGAERQWPDQTTTS